MKRVLFALVFLVSIVTSQNVIAETSHINKDFLIVVDDLIGGLCYTYSGDMNPEVCKEQITNCYNQGVLNLNGPNDRNLSESKKAVKAMLACTIESIKNPNQANHHKN